MSWFAYDGMARWQWPFASPNHLGAVLAMALAAGAVAGAELARRCPHRAWTSAGGAAWLVACAALAMTYSRGAWVALVAALAAAAAMRALTPRGTLLLALGFIAVIAVSPSGAKRLGSTTSVTDDASIANRVTVWRGAMAMAWDQPLAGVGGGRFGKIYSAWYQPLSMGTTYRSAINGPLTVAAERGLPALCAYLVASLLPLAATWIAWRRGTLRPWARIVAPALAAALISFLIAGLFTYFLDVPSLSVPALTIWSALLAALVAGGGLATHVPRRAVIAGAVIASAGTISVAGAGAIEAHRLDTRAVPAAGSWAAGCVAGPRGRPPIAQALLFPSRDADPIAAARALARPLAAAGFAVDWMDTDAPLDATLIAARARLLAIGRAVVVGDAWGAQVAAAVAADPAAHGRIAAAALLRPVMDAPTTSIAALANGLPDVVVFAGDDPSGLAEAVAASLRRGDRSAQVLPRIDMPAIAAILAATVPAERR